VRGWSQEFSNESIVDRVIGRNCERREVAKEERGEGDCEEMGRVEGRIETGEDRFLGDIELVDVAIVLEKDLEAGGQ